METREIIFSKEYLSETGSTNTYLREADSVSPLPEGYVVYTHTQSAGRGQRGNHWESEPGKNLTFSLVLRPEHIPANRQFLLSQAVSLAMMDLLDPYADGFSVKWPNDIYWKDQKISGILIENVLTGATFSRAIVGIGLNINQQIFRSDAPNPVSLCHITGHSHPIETILDEFLQALQRRYRETFTAPEHLRGEYRTRLYRGDGVYPFCCGDETFRASISGVEEDGHLLLTVESGEVRRFAFKEVSFLLRPTRG